jgi:hypothetical protein
MMRPCLSWRNSFLAGGCQTVTHHACESQHLPAKVTTLSRNRATSELRSKTKQDGIKIGWEWHCVVINKISIACQVTKQGFIRNCELPLPERVCVHKALELTWQHNMNHKLDTTNLPPWLTKNATFEKAIKIEKQKLMRKQQRCMFPLRGVLG